MGFLPTKNCLLGISKLEHVGVKNDLSYKRNIRDMLCHSFNYSINWSSLSDKIEITQLMVSLVIQLHLIQELSLSSPAWVSKKPLN